MLLALLTYFRRIKSIRRDKMDWQPQEEPLRQLAGCLRDSLNAGNPQARVQAEQVGSFLLFFGLIERPLTSDRASIPPTDEN